MNVCHIVAPSREYLLKPVYRYGKTSCLIKSDKEVELHKSWRMRCKQITGDYASRL